MPGWQLLIWKENFSDKSRPQIFLPGADFSFQTTLFWINSKLFTTFSSNLDNWHILSSTVLEFPDISRCLVRIRDPVSTMQKTGWTKNLSLLLTWIYCGDGLVWYFLVWSGKGILPMDVITKAQSTAISCVWDHFRDGDKGTPTQPGDPRASLLLTTEKAVFCTLLF